VGVSSPYFKLKIMTRNIEKEEQFYSKEFKFSYSSLNKLLFSPSLFYKDYILGDREIKTEKYLIEGSVVHCLLFEPENFSKKFNLVPGKTPSDGIIKVLRKFKEICTVNNIWTDFMSNAPEWTNLILEALKEENLFQALKLDSARLEKVQTDDAKEYWNFLNNSAFDIIDQATYDKCSEYVEVIKANEDVMALFEGKQTDFALDPLSVYAEKPLDCALKDKPFGLKGIIDFYKVDEEKQLITICDLKTTSKGISEFRETVDFYKYWLQAAIYCKLVFENLDEKQQEYEIIYKFVVIDNYKQVYVFDVSRDSLTMWTNALSDVLKIAEYHYINKNYSLPYEFLVEKVTL
jgi:hypothetical protein